MNNQPKRIVSLSLSLLLSSLLSLLSNRILLSISSHPELQRFSIMALGFVSSAAILTFEVLPMNNLVINITMTSVSKTSLLLSSSLSTVMTKTMAQVKSPYDIVALYGIGDSHNIAVRLGLCSIADIYYEITDAEILLNATIRLITR
jgi:hypothetical protein